MNKEINESKTGSVFISCRVFPVHMQSPCFMCKKNHFIDRFLSLQFQENGVALTIVCEDGRFTGRLIDLTDWYVCLSL